MPFDPNMIRNQMFTETYAGIALVKLPKYDDFAIFHDENHSAPHYRKHYPQRTTYSFPLRQLPD
jgi:hypothetical protein